MINEFISKIKEQGYFMTHEDVLQLEKIDRLFPVLVRCGGARFTCAVQDLKNMISYVEKGGDYVRDVSVNDKELGKLIWWKG